MSSYRPPIFNVAFKILIPTKTTTNGVVKKSYPKIEDVSNNYLFNGSFKSYGGTENFVNDVLTIVDTAVIETWFNPLIESDCRVAILETGQIFDILGTPENVNFRNQFLRFKVKKVGGKP